MVANVSTRSEPRVAEHSLMQGLASLPVFFDLAGRRVVLAGSSEAAAWKAELLQAAGASVALYSANPCSKLASIIERSPAIDHIGRKVGEEDLRGAALAVADMEGAEEAAAFQTLARRAGVPVNIIDRPDYSDFHFGAIVDRSPLIIGISTHGASPILAQALRGRLEALLPQAVRLWAAAAEAWRAKLRPLNLAPRARRRFWELFSRKTLAAGDRGPGEGDFATLLAQAEAGARAGIAQAGSVALVGAGPGDPELLTLKALRVLHAADVVLFDDLVSPDILDMARREATKIAVGKRGYKPSCRQDHITALLVSLAREGKRVVRLKGGDPMIFGRANEEISALQAAGIAVEIVPGITAALGAAASLQVSLTERDKARRLQFITAHAHDGKLPEDIDWRALCDPRASSVVYMGVKTLSALCERLRAHGIAPSTPAILVEHATAPSERRILGTIETLPAKVALAEPAGPCVVLIGEAFMLPLQLVDEARAEVPFA